MYYDVVRAVYEYDARIDAYLLCGGFSTREEAMQYINAHDFAEAYDGRTYECVEIEKHNADGDILSIIDVAVREFKIGDRVRVIRKVDENTMVINKTGTIIVVNADDCTYGVKFDEPVGGHTCRDRCTYGYGWFVDENDIVPENTRAKVRSWEPNNFSDKEFEESKILYNFLENYKIV